MSVTLHISRSITAPGEGAAAWETVKEFLASAASDVGHIAVVIAKLFVYLPKALVIGIAAPIIVVFSVMVCTAFVMIVHRKLAILMIAAVAVARGFTAERTHLRRRLVRSLAIIAAIAVLLEVGRALLPGLPPGGEVFARLPGTISDEVTNLAGTVWRWWGL